MMSEAPYHGEPSLRSLKISVMTAQSSELNTPTWLNGDQHSRRISFWLTSLMSYARSMQIWSAVSHIRDRKDQNHTRARGLIRGKRAKVLFLYQNLKNG